MTVRWGIAAPGGIAAQFAEGLRLVDGAVITAVGSRARERADAFGDRFDIPNRHGSYEDLVNDSAVDVVYVATPHAQHEAVVLAALEAGKHVLCEKPFALNEKQARRMADAARSRGLFAMEALWSRFLPAYRILADALRDGRIGEPLLVEADFGFRVPLMPEHRLFDLAQGGGALLDLGIYPLQLCSMVLGFPDSAVAKGHVGETGADEQVAAVLHHPGGRLGVIKAATRIPLSNTARISGSDGWIEFAAMMHRPTRVGIGSGSKAEWIDAEYEGEGLRFQAEEVQRCLAAGETQSPVAPLEETISLAHTMDDIRAQIGVVYAADAP